MIKTVGNLKNMPTFATCKIEYTMHKSYIAIFTMFIILLFTGRGENGV